MSSLRIVMQPRTGIGELIDACVRGELPFDGPNSLYSKVRAMGYNGNSLYEMVRAREDELRKATP